MSINYYKLISIILFIVITISITGCFNNGKKDDDKQPEVVYENYIEELIARADDPDNIYYKEVS